MEWTVLALFRRLGKEPRGCLRPGGRPRLEVLEDRTLPSVNVLGYHNDNANTGQDLGETQLTPANVQVGSFGKLFTAPVDGQVYAQPLVLTGVAIAPGPNTSAGASGVHDIVLVATEHDSLYAIDANHAGTGAVLWKRTFLDLGPNDALPGATAITTVPSADTGSADISPEIGITGTPVIDPATGTVYVVVQTKENVGGVYHDVQRLHAIKVSDGTDRATPFLIGDTTNGNTNNTPIYVYGTGDGSVTDPYNNTGTRVVQFNALRENQRCALSLVNNTVYVEWASHGDNGPYHGWIAAWDVSNLTTTGFQLKGVFNTTPNSGEAGIWEGGGRPAFEADGSAFYVDTGNGPGNHGSPKLDANGFPVDGDYPDAVIKIVADSTTSPTHQNLNGWGLKAADYFIPSNQAALDNADQDFGSGGPMLLPDSAGVSGHPHLLVAAGKEGRIYLLDRDNLGKFDPNNDHAVNAVPVNGHLTVPVQIGGVLSTPAWYNGKLYVVSGYNSVAAAFTINPNGTLSSASQTSASFGYIPGSPAISANGSTNGIVWIMDRNLNQLHAYDANTLATELWNSGKKAGGTDNVGAVVKFANPTVANGEVFVGTTNSLVVYGLTPPAGTVPNAPTLKATALSSTSVSLTWTDATQPPNSATGYEIDQSTDGVHFTAVTTAPAGSTALALGGLSPLTTYYFQVRGFNGVGYSSFSNVANATTTNQVAILNFSGGFAGSAGSLTYNGSAANVGVKAELTNGGQQQAGSVFSSSTVNVSKFTTQFTFQLSAGTSTADGFTFTIQGNSRQALGAAGGSLGYAGTSPAAGNGIGKSVAIKFDLFNNAGEGPDSTGLYLNGAAPTSAGSINLTPTGLDLHGGDVFQANLAYDGTTLTVALTDTRTGKVAVQHYAVNIPAQVGGTAAYVGFTGSTGGLICTQDILTWTFAPNAAQAPAAPSGLGASAASATSVSLTWTNNATNQTGFHLDRATDPNFTQNLITLNLPAAPSNCTDVATGLAPGGTYYYRLRATNAAGDSANSNVAMVSIPLAPAKPTNAQVTDVTAGEIDLSWTDNAGRTATDYLILRAVNHGSFTPVATLPALNATPPGPYTWSDTSVLPGNFYEYHIEAENVSGHNDFTGTNAFTLTLPPSGLTAEVGPGVVNLSWTAPAGAVSYNVYRGTQPGGEGSTPLATGVLATGLITPAFSDTTASGGTTYYYTVTAVNGNTPPLPAASAASNEVSATPGVVVSLAGSLNYSSGFASTAGLQLNGAAKRSGTVLQLTDGGKNEAASAFSAAPVIVTQFMSSFDFQLTGAAADGFTFTLQGNSPQALGAAGGSLGYAGTSPAAGNGIGNSVAIKFDLYNNAGEGSDSTGLYLNGVAPTNAGAINLSSTGINLHSGHVFNVALVYNGTVLQVTIKDKTTGATATQLYTVDIAGALHGSTGFVGFTAGTGGLSAVQNILDWTYQFTP